MPRNAPRYGSHRTAESSRSVAGLTPAGSPALPLTNGGKVLPHTALLIHSRGRRRWTRSRLPRRQGSWQVRTRCEHDAKRAGRPRFDSCQRDSMGDKPRCRRIAKAIRARSRRGHSGRVMFKTCPCKLCHHPAQAPRDLPKAAETQGCPAGAIEYRTSTYPSSVKCGDS